MVKSHRAIKRFIALTTVAFSIAKIAPRLYYFLEEELLREKKRMKLLVGLYAIAGFFILSIWFCLLGMGLLYLISLDISPLLAMFVITAINISFLLFVIAVIYKQRKLCFQKLHRLLQIVKR